MTDLITHDSLFVLESNDDESAKNLYQSLSEKETRSILDQAIESQNEVMANIKQKFIEMFEIADILKNTEHYINCNTDSIQLVIKVDGYTRDINICNGKSYYWKVKEFDYVAKLNSHLPSFSTDEVVYKDFVKIQSIIVSKFFNVNWDKMKTYWLYVFIWKKVMSGCNRRLAVIDSERRDQEKNHIKKETIKLIEPFIQEGMQFCARIKRTVNTYSARIITVKNVPTRSNAKFITVLDENFKIIPIDYKDGIPISEAKEDYSYKTNNVRIPLNDWQNWLYDNGFLEFELQEALKNIEKNREKSLQES